MSPDQLMVLREEEIIKISQQLRIAYQLKRTLRYAGSRDVSVHGESVAEHVFALLFLAEYFLPLEDPKGKLDKLRIHELILFHDFGEIPNGDIPYHIKTKADEEKEREDAEQIFDSLPQPLGDTGRNRWLEYEERKTPESLFVYALDKIEPVFELLDPISQTSLKRNKFTYEMHTGKKLDATKNFPIMRRFVEVLSPYIKAQGVFWEE